MDIAQLTGATFREFVNQDKALVVVKAPGCHACVVYKGNIDYVASERPDLPIGVIDLGQDPGLVNSHMPGLSAVPTTVYYQRGHPVFNFAGAASGRAVLSYLGGVPTPQKHVLNLPDVNPN